MLSTLLAVVDPGDEVIIFEPYYENYGPDSIISGAVPRFVRLREPDWTFDPRGAGSRVQQSHARHHHQHAEQPHGEGLYQGRAGVHRQALPEVGRPGHHRRDLRAHHLRRATSMCRWRRFTGMPDRTITINGCRKPSA
jgi:aminotransferase